MNLKVYAGENDSVERVINNVKTLLLEIDRNTFTVDYAMNGTMVKEHGELHNLWKGEDTPDSITISASALSVSPTKTKVTEKVEEEETTKFEPKKKQ